MKSFFITGTDTSVGKTIVSAVLTKALNAIYWKPIQSGIADEIADDKIVKKLTDLGKTHFHPSTYQLQKSLSPDQAAEFENVKIKMKNLLLPNHHLPLIIEGAGGVLVPLTPQACMRDLIKQFNLPVLIVARGTLGTINHTLLTIEALRHKNIPIVGIVYSGEVNPANVKSIEKWGKVKTLFCLPFFKTLNALTILSWINENHSLIVKSLEYVYV